jgi:hypothetical protein
MEDQLSRLFGTLPYMQRAYVQRAEFPPVNVWAGVEGRWSRQKCPRRAPSRLLIVSAGHCTGGAPMMSGKVELAHSDHRALRWFSP